MKTLLHWFSAIAIALIFYNCTGSNGNINNNEQSDYYEDEDSAVCATDTEEEIYVIVGGDDKEYDDCQPEYISDDKSNRKSNQIMQEHTI